MIAIPGYRSLTQIYESANSLVYRGIRKQDHCPVILKVLKENYPTPSEVTRYKQEYQITKNLKLEGVIKAYSLEALQKTFAMVLEDFGGTSLKLLMNDKDVNKSLFLPQQFLPIAIKVTEILSSIHGANIIHKDLNPSNLVFNPQTGEVKIIDFGIASVLNKENPTLKNPELLEGTLAYISPEQTGRMNRALNYQTDFYSLGVSFYELLTGKLPFESKDPLELLHCHLAKQPETPHSLNPKIPQILSEIILKMMAKTVEERYQSGGGIKADLEKCLENLENPGKIAEFALGSKDVSDKFIIPQKLYGREAEVKRLLAGFYRVAKTRNSKTEMMLVSGYSGIGKSVLVREIYKPITAHRGYFIAGKFDQFKRNIPYSAAVSAFKELMGQILTESEAKMSQWRRKILEALGLNGRVIIDVIPEVELIIGKQPPVAILGGIEARNRFNFVFQKFIRVFCSKEHPLVIFLDDLQWVDSATLNLIKLIMSDRQTEYLFLIGAYRDNEVSPTHPLMLAVEDLIKEGAIINSIQLAPLSLENIESLIADAFNTQVKAIKLLAEMVKKKTGGNPFFINQFLKTLDSDRLIKFDKNSLKWQWNLAEIEAQNITDNVVSLTIANLQKLPVTTQELLQLAACVGANFDLNTLSIICQKSPEIIFQELLIAVHSEVILPTSELDDRLLIENYQFQHDRVQQAAYSLIEEKLQKSVSLKIGRLLWQNTAPEVLEEAVFKIADYLNIGIEFVEDEVEKKEIAQLNLMAGQKAKVAAAYGAAYQYFNAGLKLLNAQSWQQDYNLSLSLHEDGTEAAFLSGNFEEMELLAEIVLKQAKHILQTLKIYDVKIQAALSLGQPKAALKIGLIALEKLGFKLSEKPTELEIKKGLEKTISLYAGGEIEDLINLPKMTAAEAIAASYICSSIAAAAYMTNPELLILIVLLLVSLSIEYGHAPWGAFSYAAYGLILCTVLEDIESGYKFGKLALNLAKRSNAKDTCKSFHVFGGHILHRKEHIRKTVPILIEAYQVGRETGDLEYATYAAFMVCFHSYYLGNLLEKLEAKIADYSQAIAQLRREVPLGWMGVLWQTVLNLQDKSKNPLLLIGDGYNEERSLPMIMAANDRQHIHLVYASKLILCYLLENYELARENAVLAAEYLDGPKSMIALPVFYTYDSLANLMVYSERSASQKQTLIEQVNSSQEKLHKWASHAPENYQHKFNLVAAEKARVLGEIVAAMDLYEKAIKGARENQFIQDEALAYELAAKFYLGRSLEEIAQTYLTKAHYCYLRWGATVKVKDLEAKYPHLIDFSNQKTRQIYVDLTNTSTSTESTYNAALDLAAVMKATTAISSEILLDKLLVSLMKIILENAGAEKGYLILEREGKLLIEAEAIANPEKIKVLQSLPIENSDLVCQAIVNYVARTKETLVLNDAGTEGKFTNDPYIKQHELKSIVCHPLIAGGTTVSIVYLENNLATGAFTSERVEILKMLSSPAAISIENARLYANLAESHRTLETKVEERTAELAIAKQKAEVAAEAKGAFLANMSHELRSPLNAILGFAQLMIKSPTLPPKYKEQARIINNSGEHLLAVINEVLDMAKIESGRPTLNEAEFELAALLDDLRGMFYLKAGEKGLQFLVESDLELPALVVGDEVKLRQILINLLSNAFKFTSQGRVTLAVAAVQPAEMETVTLAFEVRDTGSGMTAEELESIFEAFVQTKSGGQVRGGTGLGLTISRHFVRLMGGEMTVESEAGKGSVFKFALKCQSAVGGTPGAAIQERKLGFRSSTQPTEIKANQGTYRILVADDRPENRQLLVNLLEPLGFEIREATNGREAIRVWESWQPHLIFMDLQMPVMDGFQAVQEIRSREEKWTSNLGQEEDQGRFGPNVKIVMVTASLSEAHRQTALEVGCDDFLVKPFQNADIIEITNKTIGVEYIDTLKNKVFSEKLAPVDVALVTPAAITALPPELVEDLEAAIIRLNLEAMEDCLEKIRPENLPLSAALEALINDFNYTPILNAIKEAKNKYNAPNKFRK